MAISSLTRPQRSGGSLAQLLTQPMGGAARKPRRIKRAELAYLLRNLATLIDNGLPLAKSLGVLAQERSLRRHAELLEDLRRKVEGGGLFSAAAAGYPESFGEVMLCQIRAGERGGTLGATLQLVAKQIEDAGQVRAEVIRKLAYPTLLMVAGSGAVTFLLMFVIPIFQKTYDEAGIPLPWITQALVEVSGFLLAYGWIMPVALTASVVTIRSLRKSPATAPQIDRLILKLPIFGEWLRNIVVLSFMEVLGNLLESGFKVVEALEAAKGAVTNAAIAQCIDELQSAVLRGERFSREIDNLGDLFPPVVSQLIVIGERTGSLGKATSAIRQHLRREIDHQTKLMVGILEPALTIGLAVLIGSILLAIYLPMFDMIGAVNGH